MSKVDNKQKVNMGTKRTDSNESQKKDKRYNDKKTDDK